MASNALGGFADSVENVQNNYSFVTIHFIFDSTFALCKRIDENLLLKIKNYQYASLIVNGPMQQGCIEI
jgi:hypothetical protein